MSEDPFDGINWVCKRCSHEFNILMSSMNDYRCPKCRTRVSLDEVKKKPWTQVCKDQFLILSPSYGGVKCKFTDGIWDPPQAHHCLVRKRVKNGNCPSCKESISIDDLAPFFTPFGGVAWVCIKCETIIGFEKGIPFPVASSRTEEGRLRMDDDRMMFEQFYK